MRRNKETSNKQTALYHMRRNKETSNKRTASPRWGELERSIKKK